MAEIQKSPRKSQLKTSRSTKIVFGIAMVIFAAMAVLWLMNGFSFIVMLGIGFAAWLPLLVRLSAGSDYRRCPHCYSAVPSQASVCRYCTRDLPPLSAL